MRNMGSSVGTSIVTTLIDRRSQFHQARLVQNARVDNPNFVKAATGSQLGIWPTPAWAITGDIYRAYARIYQSLQAQAASLAYIDTFMVLAVGAAIMFLMAFALRRMITGAGGHVIVE